MGLWTRVVGALAVVASMVAGVAGHGYLAEPAARNVLANSNFCMHCLSAGGPGVTFAGGRKWPNLRQGVCGDPHTGPLDHEAGGKFFTGKITGTYAQGQTITLKVKITAPHGGRFSFRVCPVPDGASGAAERKAVTQKCLDANKLTNAKDGTPYWWFGKKPAGEYTMDFKLPPNVTCKRCVLQWFYETGNSCTIPGTPKQHVLSPNMVPCDQTGNMETFANCADISISKGKGEPAGSPTTKPPKPKKKAKTKAKKTQEGYANFHGFLPPDAVARDVRDPLVGVVAIVTVAVLPLVWAAAIGTGTLVYLLAIGARADRRRDRQDRRQDRGAERPVVRRRRVRPLAEMFADAALEEDDAREGALVPVGAW